jgi:SAM-dependent methyltransferase
VAWAAPHAPAGPAVPRRPSTLVGRFKPADVDVFTADERGRFLEPLGELVSRIDEDPGAWTQVAVELAWELLYRLDPELYSRLIAGETLHPGIIDWLPDAIPRAVEVGAGLGRLTVSIAPRCGELVAVEPAAPLRAGLKRRLRNLEYDNVAVVPGFFDELPVPSAWADATLSCSAFCADPAHGGDPGLAELDRVTRPGGLVVLVWPPVERGWLESRGFRFVEFPGPMWVEFPSLEEALEIASIFYPHAVSYIVQTGSRRLPYEFLGMSAPSCLAWRRV